MAISVMIQRTFNEKEKAAKLAPLIVKLRSLATTQPGYITGRTFRCLDCPGEYLVISTWNRLEDWNRWLHNEPQSSLDVLGLMFSEPHPYPRTSVGNNLSDLSRRNPELIFRVVGELVANDDKNSAWIAHRACRNLVKIDPVRVLDLLGLDQYHYKDRHFSRIEGWM